MLVEAFRDWQGSFPSAKEMPANWVSGICQPSPSFHIHFLQVDSVWITCHEKPLDYRVRLGKSRSIREGIHYEASECTAR